MRAERTFAQYLARGQSHLVDNIISLRCREHRVIVGRRRELQRGFRPSSLFLVVREGFAPHLIASVVSIIS